MRERHEREAGVQEFELRDDSPKFVKVKPTKITSNSSLFKSEVQETTVKATD